MVLFESMQTVAIWSVVFILLLAWIGSGKQPIYIIRSFVKLIIHSRPFLIAFVSFMLLLVINKYQLDLEAMMSISWDFTPLIYQIEGQFVYHLQQFFEHPALTPILAFFYLVIFQAIIIASIGVYAARGLTSFAVAICYAITFNYIIALPFYFWVPVDEVWSYAPSGVSFLMLDTFPTFEENYRAFSGLDNCFPSLHTSISATVAIVAWRSGIRRWIWIACPSAVIIIFSIFYLGIHWVSDMFAGLALAAACSWIGFKLAGISTSRSNATISIEQQASRSLAD
ncbi:phosphatase PAP2 family protein [Paenibacillus assamensis]|uniref:phosphatase PAP2 family protein n=1 Tax=Paenibacillus assamensis TaxID=311244 RepID=UPI000415648E|nr:phosphatase PAP2 family protein [Paenibacillus assamensis]